MALATEHPERSQKVVVSAHARVLEVQLPHNGLFLNWTNNAVAEVFFLAPKKTS